MDDVHPFTVRPNCTPSPTRPVIGMTFTDRWGWHGNQPAAIL